MIGMNMRQSISNHRFPRFFCAICALFVIAALALTSCEKAPLPDASASGNDSTDGEITLRFQPTNADTRAAIAAYFTKLNVQLFDADGAKVFDKVKTQTKDDDDFGSMSVKLTAGTYTVVAVGHSSAVSATIKSPTVCQFTAKNGEKLTDTFCHCSQIVVSGSTANYTLPMYRAVAMIQFILTDETVPSNFAYFRMDYTGGSANFNPTTMEGITKSSQSENRLRNSLNIHQAYTFPYLSATGTLKITCTATASDGSTIRTRVFDNVPVTRNRITTYTGPFFGDGDGQFSQSDFSFVVHADWDGENKITF